MSTVAAIPPAPRRVAGEVTKGPADLILLLIGGMFLLIGSILSAVFLRTLPIDLALDLTTPQTTLATIESIDLDTSVSVDGEHPVELRYTFEVNGLPAKGRSQTFNYAWVDTLEASPIPVAEVEYLPSRPQWSRLKGTKRTAGAYWIAFILVFPLIGAGVAAGGIIPRLRRRSLYRDGDAVMAKVQSVGLNRSVTINGRHPSRIFWSFNVQGQDFVGSWSGFNLERFYKGEPEVPVIYDPKNPKRSILFVG